MHSARRYSVARMAQSRLKGLMVVIYVRFLTRKRMDGMSCLYTKYETTLARLYYKPVIYGSSS